MDLPQQVGNQIQLFQVTFPKSPRAPRAESHTVIPLLPRSHGNGWRRRLLPNEGIADMFGAHGSVARVWDVCLKHWKFQLGKHQHCLHHPVVASFQQSIVLLTAAETIAGWPKERS